MSATRYRSDPSAFVGAPRRSGATPNPAGTHALFSTSTYSFEAHRNETGVHVLDLESGSSYVLSEDAPSTNHVWTGFGSQVLWHKQVDGATELWIDDAAASGRPYQVGRVEGLISTLKIIRLADDAFTIVALGPTPESTAPPTRSTGKEYTSLPVRSFFPDPPAPKVLWYLRFDTDKSKSELQFRLSWTIVDILRDTEWEFIPYSGVIPMGPTNLDASPAGLVLVGQTKDQSRFRPGVWTSDLLLIPLSQLQSPGQHIKLQKFTVETFSGTVSLPIISPNGSIAFLKNEDKAKFTSKNHIFFVNNAEDSNPKEIVLHHGVDTQDHWPLNPEVITWSNDETKLLISAADTGRQKTFEISIRTGAAESSKNIPVALDTGDGSTSSVYRYSILPSDRRLLVSKTSLVDSSVFLVVDQATNSSKLLSALTDCKDIGLHRGQISKIWFKGHGDYQVHSWVVKPSYFQEGEKYPLALFIHGGPLSSWQDGWSTRWNPALFAEQGYIVVTPDVTGSTGYDEEFKEAAIRELAGRPYYDLEHCFQHVEEHIPFADTTNAVALGGSYGGYLAFWIAGQPFASKFKALVAHAGMFSASALYATDLPDSWRVLFGGYDSNPSELVKIFEKWDPAQFAHKWQTPILITHGELDRRCPPTMGLVAFTAAQMNGVESKYLNFPDEGHFILKPENSLHWHSVVIDWINRHTGKEKHL